MRKEKVKCCFPRVLLQAAVGRIKFFSVKCKPRCPRTSRDDQNTEQHLMMACSTAEWKRLAIDIFLVIAVLIFLACSHFQLISPKKCGFFCNDQSIRFPYTGDTVSVRWLLLVNLAIPILAALVIETWHQNGGGCVALPRKGFRLRIQRAGRVILDFFLGKLFAILVTEMMKLNVCELRPHFRDTCRPDVDFHKCQQLGFITNYTCTGTSLFSKNLVMDSFKSFPSAHATSAFYSCVFLILYLHVRMRSVGSRILCFWMQIMCVTWAAYCGVSRITDHRHHWWDVLVGSIVGTTVAVATVGILGEWFYVKSDVPTSVETPDLQDKRVSTRRLISTSSEPKEMETVTVKTIESTNHV